MDFTDGWRVAIIGAGVVGSAIAADHIRHGIAVELIDVDRSRLEHAAREITDQQVGRALQASRI
ncbi:MAG: 3-hydroxyacyl-CoA dehydrogenase NAD-binding domain-containing protein [Pirellulaceae bacterium]